MSLLLRYWETEGMSFFPSQINEKPTVMPMRGALLKFTFPSQNKVILQKAPASWAEQGALSPPHRLARWDVGQPAALQAQRTFGTCCCVLAAPRVAADSWASSAEPGRHTAQSLQLSSQVPLPDCLHISRTHISFGTPAIHLRPSNTISILAFFFFFCQRHPAGPIPQTPKPCFTVKKWRLVLAGLHHLVFLGKLSNFNTNH